MSQDSNTESSSSGKKKLSLKRKTTKPEASAPPPAPTPAPPAAPDELQTMRMSLKPRGKPEDSPGTSPPDETTTQTDEPLVPNPISEAASPPVPDIPPPPTGGLPPADPQTEPSLPETSPIQSGDLTTPGQPKKIPISFADDDVVETAPPFDQPPPAGAPSSGEPKPPAVTGRRKPDTRPPMLPPVLDKVAATVPPVDTQPPLAPLMPGSLDEDLDIPKHKKTKGGKGIMVMVAIFLVLLIGIVFLVIGGIQMIKSEETPPAEQAEPVANVDVLPGAKAIPAATEEAPEEPPVLPTTENTESSEIVATVEEIPPPAYAGPRQADPDVAAWIEDMRPNAVMGRRMTIQGTTYTVGQTVNEYLGITWIGHDPDLMMLTFRDKNGVLYEKDY